MLVMERVKKGETGVRWGALLVKEISVEENLFNLNVIGTAWFCRLFFITFFTET